MTLNRFCGSAQQAITVAAMGVASGYQDLVVAGGVESMSRWDLTAGSVTIDGGNPDFRAAFPTVPQGISADLIATLEGFDRADVDTFAVESQRRADGRAHRGSVRPRRRRGHRCRRRGPARRATSIPVPARRSRAWRSCAPAFAEMGATYDDDGARSATRRSTTSTTSTTPGNSSGVVDGAAAAVVASDAWVNAHGVTPRARIRATAAVGSEPVIMLTAPGPAAERCLAKAGMKTGDIDLWEVNEAFAAVPLKTMRDLDLDPERVNVNGGAIALGHPIGATGAMLIGTLLDELERRDLTTGLVTMCTGGGMGTATVIERV